MTEIISCYSVAPTQGKKTISIALANLLAANDYKVLYMELDYFRPVIAVSTEISDSNRNTREFFKEIVEHQNFDFQKYALNKKILLQTNNRNLRTNFNSISDNLDFIVYPKEFNESSFPAIIGNNVENKEQICTEFISELFYNMKNSNYDYIILNTPNELQSIFGYEVLAQSDVILNIIIPSPPRINENNKITQFMFKSLPSIQEKWINVLNMTQQLLEDEYPKFIQKPILVPFEPQQQSYVLNMKISSPVIEEQLEPLLNRLQIPVTVNTKKRGLFW